MAAARPSDEPVVDTGKTKQALHDLLIDLDTNHPADCRLCVTAQDGGDHPVTISEDDLTAAVTKAVDEAKAPLAARIAELEAAATTAATDEAAAQLQSELDAAKAEAKAATDALAATNAYLEAEAAKVTAAAEAEARKAERVEAVAKLGIFDDAYVAERSDQWAAQDAESWTGTFADYEALAVKVTASAGDKSGDPVTKKDDTVVTTAMTGRATDTDESKTTSAFADVLAARKTLAGL